MWNLSSDAAAHDKSLAPAYPRHYLVRGPRVSLQRAGRAYRGALRPLNLGVECRHAAIM